MMAICAACKGPLEYYETVDDTYTSCPRCEAKLVLFDEVVEALRSLCAGHGTWMGPTKIGDCTMSCGVVLEKVNEQLAKTESAV